LISDEAKREGFMDQLQAAADELKAHSDEKAEPSQANFFFVKQGGDARLEAAMKGIMGIKSNDVFVAIIDLQNGVCHHSTLTASCSKDEILETLRGFLTGQAQVLPLRNKP
jgi:histidinol-phosphate/aromatic aminotransferase/cobyric acid decarboxylase-like protein